MLDLKAIREDPEPYLKALARRGARDDLERVLALDRERRALVAQVEQLRAEQNRGSKQIGSAAGGQERQALIERVRVVSDQLHKLEPELARVEEELAALAERLPNVPDETVPEGETEEDNVEVRRWGEPPGLDFEPRDHLDLGEALG